MWLPEPIIERLDIESIKACNIQLDIKRDDLINPVISGNKLFKLYDYLLEFDKQGSQTLVTFGGAYSNHLHATAYLGHIKGINTVGIIRAEPHELENPTDTLVDCKNWGMRLEPISRSEYRAKLQSSQVQEILQKYPNPYCVPEGGGGELGVKGAARILDGVDQTQYDVVIVACGTGTTLSGIINGSEDHLNVIGIPVLKGASWMLEEVSSFLSSPKDNWSLELDYHFSGYGKWNNELIQLIQDIERETQLPLEPIYTGKAFYGMLDLIKRGKIKQGSRVLFIHTGGLQGYRMK